MHSRKGFTLIELLVVIAIIAILAVVVVLTLNPAELLRQSRDANRVSDMATIVSAVNLYAEDQSGAPGFSMGNASSVYLSASDPTATSTNQCQGLGMPSSTYTYRCAASSTYRTVLSSGWIPVNFSNISSGAPFGNLPVDPVDQTSSNLYYTYETNGTQFAVSSFFESQKYAKTMKNSGGVDAGLYEAGSGANILPSVGRGLVAYWPLNEGAGSIAYDQSGNGNNGAWSGTQAGSSTYYVPGKTGQWAGYFDGSTDFVTSTAIGWSNSAITLAGWVNLSSNPSTYSQFVGALNSNGAIYLSSVGTFFGQLSLSSGGLDTGLTGSSGWTFFTVTWSSGGPLSLYENGTFLSSSAVGAGTINAFGGFQIGNYVGGTFLKGAANDVRVYNRVLSASEIQEIYNAEK